MQTRSTQLRAAQAAALATVAAIALAGSAGSALGQVNFNPGPIPGGISNSLGGSFTVSGFNSSAGALAGLVGTNSRTDWSWSLPRSNFSGDVLQGQYLAFTVGVLPVQVQSLGYHLNGKWVNGGGGTGTGGGGTPTTTVAWTAFINEIIPGQGTVPVMSFGPGSPIVLQGNGFNVVDDAATMPSAYVLAAGRQYQLGIEVRTVVQVTNWSPTLPSITVTNEFGGDWSPGFGGLNASMTWRTVPAPAATGLLTLVGLAASRRRR